MSTGVDELVDDSKALTEIVEDLLTAADPRQETATEHVDLGHIAAAAVASAQARAQQRGVMIETTSTEEIVLAGAEVSLRRMIVALVDNAIDHAQDECSSRPSMTEKKLVVQVSDDGAGFAADSETRVFERFATSRAQLSESAEPRHYGLGLALVAEVATRHRGSVKATNEGPGGGGCVTVRLPTESP